MTWRKTSKKRDVKSTYPALAAWYKDMALAHLNFNDTGHQIGMKMISDYKASDAYNADPSYADAMIPVWDAEHADMVEDTAGVKQEINSFK